MGGQRRGWLAFHGALLVASLYLPNPIWGYSSARAQSGQTGTASATDIANYERLIDRALSAYQQRDFRRARQLFAEAHLEWPNARTLRGLGMADFELGEYVTAKQHLQDALQNTVKPLTGRLRTRTEALLKRARAEVGELVLEVVPSKIKLTMDNTPFDYRSGTPLDVDAGLHELQLEADGFFELDEQVDVPGGQTVTLRFELEAEPAASPPVGASADVGASANIASPGPFDPALPPPEPRTDDSSVWESPWLWVGVGVLAVAVTGAVILTTSASDSTEGLPVLDAPAFR